MLPLLGQVLAWVLASVPGAPTWGPALRAVIDNPLGMIFPVLETTGDFDATIVEGTPNGMGN